MLRVHSIESLGTYDGPGIRLVIFLQGCQFKCLYCANPDTIQSQGGELYTVENLVMKAVSQKPFFGAKGGVTISGGEPLLQAKALIPLFKRLHQEGINTCLDTNGGVLNEWVEQLIDQTDLFLLDIKQMNAAKHKSLTGVSNEKALRFAELLSERSKRVWLRYVLVPGYSDAEEDLHALGRFLAPMQNIEKLEIQPYHKLGTHKYESLGWNYALSDVPSNTEEQLMRAKLLLSDYVKEVVIN